jgi:hypothetical protein
MIDWSQCPDVESVPGRCSGQPVVKRTRLTVDAILNNADPDAAPRKSRPRFSRASRLSRCGAFSLLPDAELQREFVINRRCATVAA